MKKILAILCVAFTFLSCSNKAMKDDGIYAIFKTSSGEFICKLFYDKAPVTVGNFVGLAEGSIEFTDSKTQQPVKRPYFDGIIFHRVIKDFVIQAGDPKGDGTGGPGYDFVDEIDPSLLFNEAGILAMANRGPNTNGSQFFVTLAPTEHLNGRHTIFGKIVDGMDTVTKIGLVKTDEQANKPFTPITINTVKIVRVGEKAKAFNAPVEFAKNQEIIKKQEEEKVLKMKEFLKQIGVDESKIVTIKENGLQYFIRQEGKGKTPVAGDTIVAHYAGYLVDGTKFDSSYDRKQPFETAIGVGRVIPGWDEAFLKMKEGEKRVLILPYYLAYGERGYPPVIPAKATLIFDVELISVKKK